MSLSAATYAEKCCVSIIYGDDYIGRIAIKSLERTKYEVLAALHTCDSPKVHLKYI